MLCDNCHHDSSHLKSYINTQGQVETRCHHCGGFSSVPSARIDLPGMRLEIRRQRDEHADDFITPHTYNRTRRKMDINPDFVKLYPDQAKTYYSESELQAGGHHRLAAQVKAQKQTAKTHKAKLAEGVEFSGSTKAAVKKAVRK